jgi:hypothetical protein
VKEAAAPTQLPNSTNNRRKTRRVPLIQQGIMHADGKLIAKCMVRDMSLAGARIQVNEAVELPVEFVLALNRKGTVRRQCHVVSAVESHTRISVSAGSSTPNSRSTLRGSATVRER